MKLFKEYRQTEIKNFRDFLRNPHKLIAYFNRFDRRAKIKTESLAELLKLKKNLASHDFVSNLNKNHHSYYLTIDLDKSKDTELVRYLKRSSKKFDTNELTFSFYENIQIGSKGFSIANRIDLGILGADDLITNKINSTAEHELTHQLFKKKREEGIPSIFHGSINTVSKPIHRSKEFGGYKKYMNLEELYTWTKDMTNSPNLAVYFENALGLSVTASAATKNTKNNIKIIQEALKKLEKTDQNQLMRISQRDLNKMGIHIIGANVIIKSNGLNTNIPIISDNMKKTYKASFSQIKELRITTFEIPYLLELLKKLRDDKERAMKVFEHIQRQSAFLKDQSTILGINLSELVKKAHILKREINEDYKGFIGHL